MHTKESNFNAQIITVFFACFFSQVAKMVMAFVVIFAMCFFPSHVFLIWFYYNPSSMEDFNDFWHVVRMVGFCLSFINSCLNPITLYIVSGTFRKVSIKNKAPKLLHICSQN